MAGTLFGIPLSTVFDASGNLARGALLYIYSANSSTPAVTYSDFALTTSQVWPLEADSAGRIPAFWVADGSYRARCTTSGGVEIYDEESVTSIGASSTVASGVDSSSAGFATGDLKWLPVTSVQSGFVKCDGTTIGNGSSGATQRANADTQSAFEFLWNNLSDTVCPVSGGRGATATIDFNASKKIGTIYMPTGTVASYSTGTWTPALNFGGATTGITYTTQIGNYIRVNDLVHVWVSIVLSNKGSASGDATVTGLPYAAVTQSGYIQSGHFSYFSGMNPNTGDGAGTGLSCSVASGASAIDLWCNHGDTNGSVLTLNQGRQSISNTAQLHFALTYRTSAVSDTGTTGTWYMAL